MSKTARLGLPLIQAAQAQKHVTHNESLAMLDGLVPGVVASASVSAAPASPAEGAAYIVPLGGQFGTVPAGQIAVFQGGFWMPVPAAFGWSVLVLDEGRRRVFAGARGWVPGQVAGPLGGALGLRVLDFEVVTAGAASVSVPGAIPDRVILLGVSSQVVQDVVGTTQIRVGDTSDPARFGSGIWHQGGRNVGVIGPSATYAPDAIRVSSQNGATMTGGRVRLAVSVIELDAMLPGVGL